MCRTEKKAFVAYISLICKHSGANYQDIINTNKSVIVNKSMFLPILNGKYGAANTTTYPYRTGSSEYCNYHIQ